MPAKEIDQPKFLPFLVQHPHLGAIQSRRLFTKDMFAGAESGESDRKMQMIGQTIYDRIDLGVA